MELHHYFVYPQIIYHFVMFGLMLHNQHWNAT